MSADATEQPWEWHPDGPEAHAMLEQIQAEEDTRPTHIVYRIGTDFSWQETPCWCPAENDHPVDQTRVIPPEEDDDA